MGRQDGTALPIELFHRIVEELPSPYDLATLARVSRVLQMEAERLLYRHIILQSLRNTIALCKRLCLTTRLATYVRSLDIYVWSYEHTSSHTFARLLSDALRRMTNVSDLCLCLPGFRGGASMEAWILSRCKFKLHKLFCYFDLTPGLFSFLETQDQIYDVSLFGDLATSSTHQIPSRAVVLPNLIVLRAFAHVALQLLPDRPVTHLKMQEVRQTPWERFVPISCGVVKALDIDAYVPSSSLPSFAKVAGAVELLHISCLLGHGDTERLYGMLSVLPSLRVLEIDGWRESENGITLKKFPEQLLRLGPSLQTVVVYTRIGYTGDTTAWFWERGMADFVVRPWELYLWDISTSNVSNPNIGTSPYGSARFDS